MKLYLNMKRIPIIALGAALLLAACTPGGGPITLESRQFSDATEHAELKFDVELPLPADKAAAEIRRQLVGVMDEDLSHIDTYEEARAFPPFDGDVNDAEALFSYYETKALEAIGAASDADIAERAAGIRESEGLTEEEKQGYISSLAGWGHEFSLKKTQETEKYVVFDAQTYIYRGGTHGGIIGAGPLTFSKRDGARITDFFLPDCLTELQPLLTKAMEKYFSTLLDGTGVEMMEILDLKDGQIPLPVWAPYPSGEGLNLVYQQYEIGAYALGMPSCILPWDEVEPFLTPAAKAIL